MEPGFREIKTEITRQIKHYISALRSEERPIKLIISRLLWMMRLSRFFTIQRELYRLRFHPSSLSAAYWINPDTRKTDEDFFVSFLKKGDVVIDVGANVGNLTLTAAAVVGPFGSVFSIEAHPIIFKYLQQNVAMNNFGNVYLFNLAVADKTGTVFFSDKRLDDRNEVVLDKGLEVPVDKLDNLFFDKIETVNLLKIDVEGYEKFVLQGASLILQKTQCIYFECEEEHFAKYGYTATDVFELLISSGFNIYRLKAGNVSRISSTPGPETFENLLAIRDLSDFMERLVC